MTKDAPPDRDPWRPLAAPAARPVAYLAALTLLIIAGIAVHDLLCRWDIIDRPQLIAGAADWLATRDWSMLLLPASIIAVLFGLLFVAVSVKPRRPTHLRANSPTPIWLRQVDVARVASLGARRCPGVLSATSAANHRTVLVTVEGGGTAAEELTARIHSAVEPIVDATVANAPQVKVRIAGGARR